MGAGGASSSRCLQWSVLGLQRQSSPTFPLPPQLRARLKLRPSGSPNLPAPQLHSNVRAQAPGSGLQRGGHTLEALARPLARSPRQGPVGEGETGAPGAPRERAERSRALGPGGRELPARNVASRACERRSGALARDGQEEG